MGEKKEETRNRPALASSDDFKFPKNYALEYSTTVSALQGAIDKKFTPKRKRAEAVAGLYAALARRVESMGAEGVIAAYLELEGEKGFNRIWDCMHFMTGEEILYHVRAWLVRWYSGHGYAVDDCGTFLKYRVTQEAAALVHANFCRDRLCPLCNWRRSLKVFGQVSKIMTELDGRGYRYLFLTLTIRNVWGNELSDAIQALYDGWRELYHHYMAGPIRTAEKRLKDVVMGTFRAVEVTVSDGKYSPEWAGSFHPHLHAILAMKDCYFKRGHYLTTSDWSDIWKNACGLDYNPSIKIEAVRSKESVERFDVPTEAGRPLDYAGAVAELSKYPLKDADFVGADTAYNQQEGQYMDWLLKALRRRRLVGLTGCFKEVARALMLDDMESGDLVNVDGEPEELRDDVRYLVVNYNWRCGAYAPSFYEIGGTGHRDETYRLSAEEAKRRGLTPPDSDSE